MKQIHFHTLQSKIVNPTGFYLFILIMLLFTFCASPYHSMSLGIMDYNKVDTLGGIAYGYHFNVLRDFRNNAFVQKENQMNIKLVAFTFSNLSERKIDLASDLEYFQTEANSIRPLEPDSIMYMVRLDPKKYRSYLMLMFLNAYWFEPIGGGINSELHLRMIPVGIFLGPFFSLYNMSIAKRSNFNFGKDLDKYSPFSIIQPGATRYVLIAFKNIDERPIQIRLKGYKK